MKWAGACVGVCGVLVVAMAWSGHARAAVSMDVSQAIRPLVCTVDVITVGASVTVSLSPAECMHSGAARALVAQTKASFKYIPRKASQ